MRATAISQLGYRPEADDAVQDAALIALRHIGDVRDPVAVGAWLRAIVRNVCRGLARQPAAVPVDDLTPFMPWSDALDPQEALDRSASRDWAWHAVGELPAELQAVTLLRYFTRLDAYEQIAAVCDIPVGTVRSRLNAARSRLAVALLATAESAHDDIGALTRRRWAEGEHILAAAGQGSFESALADRWSPHVDVTWSKGKRTRGFDYMVRVMNRDIGAGVRQRLSRVVASQDVTIWETEVDNPPDDPHHCPPGVIWLQSAVGGRVRRLRIFHPRS